MAGQHVDALAVVGLGLATALVCLPLLLLPFSVAPGTDIWRSYSNATADWLSVVRFGQFPFRSPYFGGGYPMGAHPEDMALSPRFLLILTAGPWAAVKLDYVLTMFMAATGTYLLVRRIMGWPMPAALASAAAFAFGGYFVTLWDHGWLINARAAVFPWILYFFRRSRHDARYLAVCGVLMGILLLDAKYALAVLAWFMALWLLLDLDSHETLRGPRRSVRRKLAILGGS